MTTSEVNQLVDEEVKKMIVKNKSRRNSRDGSIPSNLGPIEYEKLEGSYLENIEEEEDEYEYYYDETPKY